MINGKPIELKSDKRFKLGNIKQDGMVFRGHPDTMKIKPLESPSMLTPPLIITSELADKLKKSGII